MIRLPLRVLLLAVQVSLLCFSAPAQTQQASSPSMVPPMQGLGGRDALILRHLDTILPWYHNVSSRLPTIGLPSDEIYQGNARTLAVQATQAAFQSATADAVLLSKAPEATTANAPAPTYAQLAPQLDAQIAQLKAQIEALTPQIAVASGSALRALQEQRTRLQGNLELVSAEDAAVDQLVKFSASAGSSGSSELQRSIVQLQRSVPEISTLAMNGPAAGNVAGNGAGNPAGSNARPAVTVAPAMTSAQLSQAPSGLIGQAEALFSYATSLHKIDLVAQQTMATEDLAKQLRAPLLAEIHRTMSLAASWAAAPGSPQGNPATSPATGDTAPQAAGTQDPNLQNPAPTKQQFDALTARFKQLAAASIPLSQEIIYLDQSRTNLTQWRQALVQENHELIVSVLTRVSVIALCLGGLIILSSIWRRFIFRYVHDIRRRRQLLILRRVVIGFLIGLVLILGFVSEFSSLATFAGFITAGIAVGLQTILLSVAAYFFLVGRFGIRVGDRISISGVTGDVIEVGLVRLYMLELAGTGTDIFPTGRIVVLPNSVLFQATVPLFKQIPGTDYAWHEVSVLLASDVDGKMVVDEMLAAVQSVHEHYRVDFERQHQESSRRIDLVLEVPSPSALLQFAAAGLESVVRFPVSLTNTARADQQVTEAVLAAIHSKPNLKAAITGTPQIRVAVKG